MSSTPASTNQPAGPVVDLWGGVLRVPAGSVEDVICLRISARNAVAYANQHETGRQVFNTHRDAKYLDALPDNLFERGPNGDATRRRHHVVPVGYADLPYSGGKTGLIGYAYVGGRTLFLFVMDSAALANLPALPGDTSGLGRNAFTEVVAWAATTLYKSGSSNLALRFAYWSRMDRDEHFGSKTREVVRRSPGMTLWAGTEQIELHSASSRLMVGVRSGESSAQVTTLKESTFIGCINKLRANRWDRSEAVLPFGFRFAREECVDGLSTPKRGVVEVDAGSQSILVELVTMAANGATWSEIGARAAALKVRLRGQRHARSKKTFADLPEGPSREAAARQLLGQPEIISLWRTGTWIVRRHCPLPGVKTIREYVMEFLPGEQFGFIDVSVTWPLPDGGWGVDDATWERLLRRVTATSRGRSGVASSEIERRPLGGMNSWIEGEHQFRLVPDSPTAYRLRRRPVAAASNAEGRARGWFTGEGEALATFHATAVHNSVATALEQGLVHLIERGHEVGVLPAAARSLRENRSHRDEEADALYAEAEELDAEARTNDGLARLAVGEGRELSAANYIEEAENARRSAESKRRSADRLRAVEEPTEVEEVTLDLTHPAVVVGALRRYGQNAPAELARAVAALGITEHFRIHLDETGGLGCWSATCEVPVVGEDAPVSIALSGTVPNTRPREGAGIGRHRSHAADMVRKILVEGQSLHDVAMAYNRSEDLTHQRVVRWLRDHGVVARSLTAAILDCPIPETRRTVFALCAGDDELIGDLEAPYVEHLRSVYFTEGGWGHPTWAADSFRFERRLLATLRTLPGCAANKKDLADGLNVSMRQLSLRVRQSGRRAALVTRPQVQTMGLVRCPHADCPGPRWASHVLVTPETPGGLLCPACRRTPDDASVIYPAAYLEVWEGPHRTSSQRGVAKDGSTTRASGPAQPAAIRRESMLTSGEVALRLGWSEYQVRQHLDCHDMVGRVRLYDAGHIDQFIVERESENASVGDLIAVGEAAARLGVGEHRLRLLIRRGAIRTSRLGPSGTLAISAAALDDARSLLGDADLESSTCLSLGESAQRAGVTRSELRSAADRGLVECDRTAGNHRRFTIDAIDAYKASLTIGDTDATLLVIGDAARLAGVSAAALRAAVAAGRISCVRSSRGHRRFSLDDVMSYAARCGSSLHQ